MQTISTYDPKEEIYTNSTKLSSTSLQLFHSNVEVPKISNFKLFNKDIIN